MNDLAYLEGYLQINSFRKLVWLVETGFSAAPAFYKKRHQNTRQSRATAPADLEPPKGLRIRLGLLLVLGLGFGLELWLRLVLRLGSG